MTQKNLPYLVVDPADNFHVLYSHAETMDDAIVQATGANGVHIYVPADVFNHADMQLSLISDLIDDEKVYGSVAALMDAVRGVLSTPVRQALGPVVHQVPELSTCHLDQKTAGILSHLGNHNPWVHCAAWDNGFFVFLDEIEDALSPVPECLVAVRDWRRALEDAGKLDNSRWVRFDADGETVEGLPTYEWVNP